jgi:maltose/moltooligosaccharide transporter
VFNFFIVIPEIVASLGFGPMTRLLFGADNPNAPLYVVMLGGACLFAAAAAVGLVDDVGARAAPAAAVIEGDEHEAFTVQQSAQPVPSTGLAGER